MLRVHVLRRAQVVPGESDDVSVAGRRFTNNTHGPEDVGGGCLTVRPKLGVSVNWNITDPLLQPPNGFLRQEYAPVPTGGMVPPPRSVEQSELKLYDLFPDKAGGPCGSHNLLVKVEDNKWRGYKYPGREAILIHPCEACGVGFGKSCQVVRLHGKVLHIRGDEKVVVIPALCFHQEPVVETGGIPPATQ